MPPPLNREMLKSMKRTDLQRICKDYGIKANLKTEALIDLLSDINQSGRPNPPPSQRASSNRIASRSGIDSRLRGSSTSSLIIHDSDEEDSPGLGVQRSSISPLTSSELEYPPQPPPRARRAKDTQYKLGVGRPTVAGGTGARTVTRSTSLSQRGKRGKGSKSVKPTEAAIQEEEEPEPSQSNMPEAGPSGTIHDPPAIDSPIVHVPFQPLPMPDPFVDLAMLPVTSPHMSEELQTYIASLMTPLQTQIQLLQAEKKEPLAQVADVLALSSQVRSLQAEVLSLRPQVAIVPQLQAEVEQLKQMIAILTQTVGNFNQPSAKSLGKARASDEESSQTAFGGSEVSHATPGMSAGQAFPIAAQSLLGKRHRDSNDSHVTDVVEEGQEDNYAPQDLEKRAVRPTKKRPKLSNEDEVMLSSNVQAGGSSATTNVESQPGPRTAFTIFQGPEELYIEPPPPTTHLSDLLPFDASGQITPPMNGAIPRPPGADENAPNQMPPNFNFNFDPLLYGAVTSTPFDANLPTFTYPEPPTSPSPAAPSGGFIERAGGRIERNDLYQPLRRSTPAAQGRGQTPQQSRSEAPIAGSSNIAAQASSEFAAPGGTSERVPTLNQLIAPGRLTVPGALQGEASDAVMNDVSEIITLPRRTVSSTEVGIQLGMSGTLPLPADPPGAQMKRTMYGTELESDTRFGDFGVEGVASGFWAGLARRP